MQIGNVKKTVLTALFVTGTFLTKAAALGMRPNQDPNAPPPPAWVSFVPMLVMVAIFYMLLIRPQSRQRKQKQLLIDNLKKGDRVLTQGGFLATVTNMNGLILEVKLNDEVKVKIQKSAVAEVLTEEAYNSLTSGA